MKHIGVQLVVFFIVCGFVAGAAVANGVQTQIAPTQSRSGSSQNESSRTTTAQPVTHLHVSNVLPDSRPTPVASSTPITIVPTREPHVITLADLKDLSGLAAAAGEEAAENAMAGTNRAPKSAGCIATNSASQSAGSEPVK